MDKIPSFTVDHIKLKRGVYISRQDMVGNFILTTYDLRMKEPNKEPVINNAELHTIEHLGATFLRNHKKWKDDVIYFGPMGCRTGFYLILAGDALPNELLPLLKELFSFIANYEGEIPGATPKDCGNYLDMNLPMARYEANKYLETLQTIQKDQLVYPE